MSQQQLLQTAAQFGPKTKKGIVYLTEYHHRLVLPVGCFILSLLGLPLGLQAGPGRRAAGIPFGLGFFVLYYITFTTGRVLTEDMVLPLVLGMWLPNILFLLLTVYVFYRVDREKPLLPQRLQTAISWLYELLIQPLLTIVGKGWKKISSRRALQDLAEETGEFDKNLPVHANPVSRMYHFPTCEEYTCSQCTIEFLTSTIAEESGFKPCPFCKSLVEKQKT